MILEGTNLEFSYGAAAVLAGVDIRIERGITAVIGPNAAGKSTLLKCLCGLLRPQGRVTLNGRDLRAMSRKDVARDVGYLPQNVSTQAVLTVFEAVLLGRLHTLEWHVSESDIQAVEGVLHDVGVTALAGRGINQLSGGQLQLVSIAQALAREPAVLLLDEPTSNLDLRRQFEICMLLASLRAARDLSVAVAVHDLNAAARFADTVYVLHQGRIYGSGAPADVLTREMMAEVYGIDASVTYDASGLPMITPLGLRTIADL
ncbi:MAG: ABC transporter ATP-binding protein [Planctomycetaceae bacterium]|nr:ABC transporter ATP-binding protein [Planctomycetaceae bacterium]